MFLIYGLNVKNLSTDTHVNRCQLFQIGKMTGMLDISVSINDFMTHCVKLLKIGIYFMINFVMRILETRLLCIYIHHLFMFLFDKNKKDKLLHTLANYFRTYRVNKSEIVNIMQSIFFLFLT